MSPNTYAIIIQDLPNKQVSNQEGIFNPGAWDMGESMYINFS